jgi:alpha-glucuronidase
VLSGAGSVVRGALRTAGWVIWVVKLAWEMSNAAARVDKLRVVVIREQDGTPTTLQVTGADAQGIVGAHGAIFLRLKKTGNTYGAYCSNSGSVHRFMGFTTLNVEPVHAGVVAFNRDGDSSNVDVAFDYFRVESLGDRVRSQADVGQRG